MPGMTTPLRHTALASFLSAAAAISAGCESVEVDSNVPGVGNDDDYDAGVSEFEGEYIARCAVDPFEFEVGFSVVLEGADDEATVDLVNAYVVGPEQIHVAQGYIDVYGRGAGADVYVEYEDDTTQIHFERKPQTGTIETWCVVETSDARVEGDAEVEYER